MYESVELSAGTLHYRDRGPADGRVVLMVHGFLVDDTLWGELPDLLAAQGFRVVTPTWPLASHTEAMRPDADLSPRGIARLVIELMERLDLDDVTLVGNDTGGAVCQFVLDEDHARLGRLVLTNCDAFDTFPPFPFDVLFRLARHPRASLVALQTMRSARLRRSKLGYGWLVHRRLGDDETAAWVRPYLTDAGVRRDVASFARTARASDLADAGSRLGEFEKPVLICWAPDDPFFTLAMGRRLAEAFPDARLVEVPGARTFVALDQPEVLEREMLSFIP